MEDKIKKVDGSLLRELYIATLKFEILNSGQWIAIADLGQVVEWGLKDCFQNTGIMSVMAEGKMGFFGSPS